MKMYVNTAKFAGTTLFEFVSKINEKSSVNLSTTSLYERQDYQTLPLVMQFDVLEAFDFQVSRTPLDEMLEINFNLIRDAIELIASRGALLKIKGECSTDKVIIQLLAMLNVINQDPEF